MFFFMVLKIYRRFNIEHFKHRNTLLIIILILKSNLDMEIP